MTRKRELESIHRRLRERRSVTLAEQHRQAAKQREEILKLDAGDQRVAAELAKRIQLPAKELSADITHPAGRI